MAASLDPNVTVGKAAEIVVAFLNTQSVSAQDLPGLVSRVVEALSVRGVGDEASRARPAEGGAAAASVEGGESDDEDEAEVPLPRVPIAQTVSDDFIICLEDGKPYRSLRRHLMAKYQMTPDDYRRKWGLPADYPMVAPSYAAQRSLVAKRSGLGTKKEAAEATVRTIAARGRRPG